MEFLLVVQLMAEILIGKAGDRFPMLNKPDPSYHVPFGPSCKPLEFAYILKARVTLLRDLGSAMSPLTFTFIQGLETLPYEWKDTVKC